MIRRWLAERMCAWMCRGHYVFHYPRWDPVRCVCYA